jgi:hypothetical protein
VCDARADLRTEVDEVKSDITSANFGDARDNVPEVRRAFDELKAETANLADEEKDKLQPQVDKVEADLNTLTSADSLGELSTALDTTRQDVDELLEALTEDLDCN